MIQPKAKLIEVDVDLLKKYDVPGPRYTSYPTAPIFSEKFGAEQFEREIAASNSDGSSSDLSLYFHIPFCDTLCYFCGCNMLITRDRDRISEYLDYLKKEIEMISKRMYPGRKVTQLHWGGGTPTYLNPDEIRNLASAIQTHFEMANYVEAGVEIDPRGLTEEHLKALRESGFNRASMGVQDFEGQVQTAVNRVQSEETTRFAFDTLRKLEFQSINLDLIYGLPFQTASSFEKTVDRIINISPDRIAVFNYAHVPWLKKHQKVITEESLPKPEEKLRILKMVIEKLTDAGYCYIGMDHFAKPEDELTIAQHHKTLYRNFQGYSTRAGCDLYALGITGISQLRNVYAQNEKTLSDYYQAIDEHRLATHRGYYLSEDDQIRRYVIMRLMCDFELTARNVEKLYGIDFNDYFSSSLERLERFQDDGLVIRTDSMITVSDRGRLFIRNIAMCFDKYIEKQREEKQLFSRTV